MTPHTELSGDLDLVTAELRTTTPPGSQPAVLCGCTCPRAANWMGEGATVRNWGLAVKRPVPDPAPPRVVWLIDAQCPLHGHLRAPAEGGRVEWAAQAQHGA